MPLTRPWDLWIAYVFEDGTAGRGQLQKAFEYNRRDPDQKKNLRLRSLRLEDKRTSAPLQAADILAYELYRQLPRQIGLDPRPPRQPILRMLARPPRSWGTFDEDELKKWSEIVQLSADIASEQGWPRRRRPDLPSRDPNS
jgi:hypothetical protein